MRKEHPVQPLVRDHLGVIRFKENKIVSHLLDWASSRGMSLNEIAMMRFSREDQQQLAQLIGYSLSGYGDLPYVTDRAFERAREQPVSKRKAKRPISPPQHDGKSKT